MNNHKYLLWCIIVLTIFSILFILPSRIHIQFKTPKIPFYNKKIEVNKNFIGFDPNILLRPFNLQREFYFRKGLDLEGGTSLTLKAEMKDVEQSQREIALDAAKLVIERRVNFLGVAEPIVQTAKGNNDYRIIVELPGITDVDKAISLVGTTAKLEFRELKKEASLSSLLKYEDTLNIGLTGADLKDAQASFDNQSSNPVVLFSIISNSQEKFYNQTEKLVGKRMAICLDNLCFSAPTVQQGIRGSGQISGGFTTEQAKQLASQLNAGALPVPLKIIQQSTLGATLGDASLKKSLFAGFISFIIIIIFMILLYGKMGATASVALVLYAIFVLTLFKLIPITLTLAGIAGFVLSIGMAVDANILIFERMKEELRRGKSNDAALELGFSRAWSSIKDSNIASIITSIILFQFGTGIVRGFAVTLLIGVTVSMFSAITVTRTFLRMIYRK
ncbi:MAG: protein translocase subunit SecD [Candidatus Levybacteria bacterium]|nr:protein translocase subunit SecD [Candidatus Levybacteria bacterium]